MPSMRDIKRRIRSVGSIEQITRAMKMVAAARLRRVQGRMLAMRPYTQYVAAIMGRLASEMVDAEHPLLETRDVKSIGVLFFAGERGLCGAFNSNLVRAFDAFVAEQSSRPVRVAVMGRKAVDHARRRHIEPFATYEDMYDNVTFTTAAAVSDRLSQAYCEGLFDELHFVHAGFVNSMTQTVTARRVLPFDMESLPEAALEDAPAAYLTEPSAAEVLARLVTEYLTYQTYQAILESSGSEHAARMTAMDAATNNAQDVIDTLTMEFNRARQASITFELLDIVGGAEALRAS